MGVGRRHARRPLHFAYPTSGDAQEEAEHFIRTVGSLDQLRPALDLEIDPGELRTKLTPWARNWNRAVLAGLDSGPLFYSYPYFIRYMRPRSSCRPRSRSGSPSRPGPRAARAS
jgi:GH25 family lysozyme M1 (1,4-beta-N-acetylmuramidase)